MPERRRTADIMDAKLLKDIDALHEQSLQSAASTASPSRFVDSDGSSYEEYSDDAAYITESDPDPDVDEEVDVNAVLRKGHYRDQAADDTGGYLPQLFTADERKRTDIYRPRRSIPWSVMYVVLGIAGPAALGIFLLLLKVQTIVLSH